MPVLKPADWTAKPPTRRGRPPTPPTLFNDEGPRKRRRGLRSETKASPTAETPDAEGSIASSETRSPSAEVDPMETDERLKDYVIRSRGMSGESTPAQGSRAAFDALLAVASAEKQKGFNTTAVETLLQQAKTSPAQSVTPPPVAGPSSQQDLTRPPDLADAWVQKRLKQRLRGRAFDSRHPPPLDRPPKEEEIAMDLAREKALKDRMKRRENREKLKLTPDDVLKGKGKGKGKEKEREEEDPQCESDDKVTIHRHIAERRAFREFGREENHRFFCTFVVDKKSSQVCDYWRQGYTTWSDLARHCDAKHAPEEVQQIKKGTLTFETSQWVKSEQQMDALRDTVKMICDRCGTVFPSGRADSLNRHRTNGACQKMLQRKNSAKFNNTHEEDYYSEPESEGE